MRGVCIAFMALLLTSPAFAEKGKLRERLTPEVMAVVSIPPALSGSGRRKASPPAIAVYQGDVTRRVAYIFSTLDIVAAPGYSSTPFDVIAGVDLDGRITGAKVVFHNESYIVHDTVRQRLLDTFLAREAGRPLRGNAANVLPPDYVAGATISARAMRGAVLATAALVLRARVTPAAVTVPTLDVESYSSEVPRRAPRRRRPGAAAADLRRGCLGAGRSGRAPNARLEVPLRKSDDVYIDFMTGLFTPQAIGANLIGVPGFEDYKRGMADRRPGDLRRFERSLRLPRHQILSGVGGQPLRPAADGSGRADLRFRTGRLFLSRRLPRAAGRRRVRACSRLGVRSGAAVAARTAGQQRRRFAGDGRVRARLQDSGRARAHATSPGAAAHPRPGSRPGATPA